MSDTAANYQTLKNAKNAVQRMTEIELGLQQVQQETGKILGEVIKSTNKALSELEGRLNTAAEVLDAVVDLYGAEAVRAAVAAARQARYDKGVADQQLDITNKIASNNLTEAELVTENSLVVFKELDVDGKEVQFSRVQFFVSSLQPSFREEVLGKSKGYQIKGERFAFEVAEVYTLVAHTQTPADMDVLTGQLETVSVMGNSTPVAEVSQMTSQAE